MYATGRGTRGWFSAIATLVALTAMGTPMALGGGNLLILVADDYVSSAPMAQFVSAKEAGGFDVTTYTVTGGMTASQIKSYILSLWGTADAPDYILIVGDSPNVPSWVGGGSKSADTDWPYACMDGGDDWRPEIPVGRFSISSVSELQAIVSKTLFVEAGVFSDPNYVKRGTFLATSDTSAEAEATHDWVITNYFDPNGYVANRVYANQGGGTSDVTAAVNAGSLWTVYFGHSGSSGWWTPSFDQGDVTALSNNGLYGLVFGFSCNTAHYTYDECFGETWIREANKGAAAYISASTYIYYGGNEWESSRRLEKYFFESFFVDDVWEVGPAWVRGVYRLIDDTYFSADVRRNMAEMFVILGDPSLRLPEPWGFTLDSDPNGHELCSPPDSDAVYLVDVGSLGGFDEKVTLSVDGLPFGATVAYSTNGAPAPFASRITIGNLDATSAGQHDVVITGSSTSMQRSIVVDLDVFTGAAAQPTLLTPPDGATGVALRPTLTWQEADQAQVYELEVATDLLFQNVVYSRSLSGTSHSVDTALGTLSEYYWRVRASNTCGTGDYSPVFDFTTLNMLAPVSYDLLNGEGGTYTYYDDAYDGQGDNTVELAPLSGGLGDLTDGVIATQHWNSTAGPYVGWVSVDPTITFHFDSVVQLDAVTLHLDDDGGGGGVHVPDDVTVSMGGDTEVFPVTDPPGSEPIAFNCPNLGMIGDTLEITIADHSTSGYMMLSEVEFYGGPVVGACCVGGTCSIETQADCLGLGGEYQGDGSKCDPNPCAVYEPDCLIISEIVDGDLSGDCPRFIEITNTGTHDFTFAEGGVIVQMDGSSDVVVDVDLTGETISAGGSYVINSTAQGCTGAFDVVFGGPADLDTTAEFGDGNDRFILTDTGDGSNLLDIYGEFGDGKAGAWDYFDGYAYRLPPFNSGSGAMFEEDEWFFGGKNSLAGADPEQLLRDFTTPAVHVFDESCTPLPPGDVDGDGLVDLNDHAALYLCLTGPDNPPTGGAECPLTVFDRADLDWDNDCDLVDFQAWLEFWPAP